MNINSHYHTSQARKPFILRDLLDKASLSFKKDPTAYKALLSKKINKSFEYLFQFRNNDSVIISNQAIAEAVGCTTRTVERATKKFHDDGVIIKYRPDIYAMNRYYFHPLLVKGRFSFSLWFKTLSPIKKESYWKKGISGLTKKQLGNVVLNIVVDTKGFSMNLDSWKGLPESVKVGATRASGFKLSGDSNSLNGKSGDMHYFSRPYNDLGLKNEFGTGFGIVEEQYPNGKCKFCFECFEDLSYCKARGGHDKVMKGKYMKKRDRESYPGSELVSHREAAAFVGISRKILESWECEEGLLAYEDPFTGENLYRRDDLLEIKNNLSKLPDW